MSEGFDRIIVSFFAGVAATVVSAFVTVGIVGYGFERPEFTPFAALFIGFGILVAWLTYRAKYISAFDDLCKQYPNGVRQWAKNKGFINSVGDDPKNMKYSHKTAACKEEKQIINEEQGVRDRYAALKKSYPYGLKTVENQNKRATYIELLDKIIEIRRIQENEDRRIKQVQLQSVFNDLEKNYPHSVNMWLALHKMSKPLKLEQLELVCSEKDSLEKSEKAYKQRIATRKEIDDWKSEHAVFTKHCRDLHDDYLDGFGCYCYDIDIIINEIKTSKKYTVWQSFAYSFCSETDLDYTHFQSKKRNTEIVSQGRYSISESVAKSIAEYINKLYSEEETAIYFCPPDKIKDIDKYISIYGNIVGLLNDSVKNELIYDPTTDNALGFDSDITDWVKHIKKRIVVVDVATENYQLRDICREVIDATAKSHPLITFISLYKGYDREEMVEQINEKRKQIAEEEEKKRKEEERKKAEKLAKQKLIEAVSSWDTLSGGLHYSYFFYYYPTTCEFEATEDEWDNRWTVWNFKNTPGKTSAVDHQQTLNHVIPMVKNRLKETFGESNLKYLTLVCIPASSQSKTQLRYEEFSNRLCSDLGLINAYSHITVTESREARHLGGGGTNLAHLSFDEDFFKDKYILLFDDVITRGDSMRVFALKMQRLGAKVVGGLSLGKTKHERPIQGSIPQAFSRPVFPSQQNNSYDDDDLPF